ncbi:unnamed protein product [Allacma fusca]|uniref:Uncharacterized protein n=2 Tax=Allacma fusca TaxID=39272 RepID=A0A8J2PGY0_9HEXA|nr:unnamed protein product [Allacma fusca]
MPWSSWIFVLNRKMFLSKLQIIKGIQAAIMISNGAILLIYLLQDTIAKKCFQQGNVNDLACQEFEIRILIGFTAIFDGFIYLARRPILPEFIVEMEPEDSHFHRRFLGDGEDYLKELKRNSRGSVILDQEGRGMYASYPNLDDYIVKVDVLPEFINPNVLTADPNSENNDLMEISELDVTKSSKGSNRTSFYLNQEYFLPNLPKRTSKAGGPDEDNKYSTLTRDFAKI